MKRKQLIAGLLVMLCVLILVGCQLAREDMGEKENTDRLVGVFITTEYLDLLDGESYFGNSNGSVSDGEIIVDGNTKQNQGRLYAVLMKNTRIDEDTGNKITTEEYIFKNIEGISYFTANVPVIEGRESYTVTCSDEAISDGRTGFSYQDDEDKVTLEGTIYLSPARVGKIYYINPVYQSADGSVYTMSGNGFMVDGENDEGPLFSHDLDETTIITENSEIKKVTASVKISLSAMLQPEKIIILQLDKNSSIVFREEYTPGEVPNELTVQQETEYVIVETYKTNPDGKQIVTREILAIEDEMMFTFFCRKDGICIEKETKLIWRKVKL